MTTGTGARGRVTDGPKVTFTTTNIRQYAEEITKDEGQPVTFLRKAVGISAVERPTITLDASFTGAAMAPEGRNPELLVGGAVTAAGAVATAGASSHDAPTPRVAAMDADINFYFDPVCPFAWMTSKWVRQVQRQRDYTVDWRFISLRLINAEVDYDAQFPPEYEAGHTAGLRLLRVAARARAEHGREAMSPLYAAFGARIFDTAPNPEDRQSEGQMRERRGTHEFAMSILAQADLPLELADAVDDESWDVEIRQETDEALALTGKDVGTPIIHFEPPTGVAFFGPVISRLPGEESAVELWDHVVGLARFPGFAELKRSLREQPQLAALGGAPDTVGTQEDWHGGSRRQKK